MILINHIRFTKLQFITKNNYLLLIIRLHFTSREGKICSTIKKSQNIMNRIVGTKFHLKLIILNFWTKLTQKGYFQSKEYSEIRIEFYIFELA